MSYVLEFCVAIIGSGRSFLPRLVKKTFSARGAMLRPVFEDDAEQTVNASIEERLRESELRVAFLEGLLAAKNSALKSALGVGDEPQDDDYEGEENSPAESGGHLEGSRLQLPPLFGSSPLGDRESGFSRSLATDPIVSPIPIKATINALAQDSKRPNEPATDRKIGSRERTMVALQAGDFIRLRKDGQKSSILMYTLLIMTIISR